MIETGYIPYAKQRIKKRMVSLLNIFANAAQAAAPAGGTQPSMAQPFLLIGAMVFFLWLVVLRPQKKEKAKRESMINAMKKGDRVITIGGMHGKISDIDTTHNTVTVEVAPKISVKFNRTAIASVDPRGSEQTGSEPEQKVL